VHSKEEMKKQIPF